MANPKIILIGCLSLMTPGLAGAVARAAPAPYIQPTAEQEQAAIAAAQRQAVEVAKELHLRLREVQTNHCLIFTDWDPRETSFLRANLEGAYAAVSRQFNLSPRQNIFLGKLPVYMLATQDAFMRFAQKVDHYSANDRVAGYYYGRTDGIGHLVMWKPKVDGSNVKQARQDWAYVLAHEFTHAFVARYRTNALVPTWLNEGLAEVVASGEFPRPQAIEQAREMAGEHRSIAEIFNAEHPDAPWYPVMQTLVQTLIARDHRAFLSMFDDVKNGIPIEKAMKNRYGWSEADLERAWRRYVAQ
jgi:hypothetical protein